GREGTLQSCALVCPGDIAGHGRILRCCGSCDISLGGGLGRRGRVLEKPGYIAVCVAASPCDSRVRLVHTCQEASRGCNSRQPTQPKAQGICRGLGRSASTSHGDPPGAGGSSCLLPPLRFACRCTCRRRPRRQ
ncbi:unnamed protein product, partial [Ectocarpus sp. 8 AP-2014]